MVWKPTYDIIVSDCALKSFVFGARIPKSYKIIAVLKEVRCAICRKVRTQHRTSIIAFFFLFVVCELTEVSCILYQLCAN